MILLRWVKRRVVGIAWTELSKSYSNHAEKGSGPVGPAVSSGCLPQGQRGFLQKNDERRYSSQLQGQLL